MKNLYYYILGVVMACGAQAKAQTFIADPGLETAIRLYGEPIISANPDLLNSTSNDAGPWGSPDFLYSFANDVGPLGSPEALRSVSNDYGAGLRVHFTKETLDQVVGLRAAVELYGEPVISANPDLLNSTANEYGPWGSPDSLYSFTNDYGPLGSPDTLQGVANEYGAGLEFQLVDPALELDAP